MSTKNPLEKRFAASTEALPPSDPKDVAVKTIEKKCRDCIEVCRELDKLDHDLFKAKNARDFDEACRLSRLHGINEERYYELRSEVNELAEKANKVDGFGIFVVYTESGTPIRVKPQCKKSPWE